MPPGEENVQKLVRAARLDLNTVVLILLLGGGTLAGLGGSSKLDQCLELSRETKASVGEMRQQLDDLKGSFAELKAKVDAGEKLRVDDRLRNLEGLGLERRLEVLETAVKKEK